MSEAPASPATSPPLRIAFFSDRPPERMEPYMREDFDALQELGQVVWCDSSVGRGWRRGIGPTGWLPPGRILRLVRNSDLVFQWFATPLAPVMAARLLRRPALVVTGGYDVAAVADIGYGLMLDRRTRWMTRLTLRSATGVLCMSASAEREARRHAPEARTQVVYPGLDASRFQPASVKTRQVVTIGAVSEAYSARKGLATFAATSRLMSDIPFVIVGRHVEGSTVERLRSLGGPNLQLRGWLPDAELVTLLETSAVYAQLSRHEGFGYALAEAMLAGCTPVVTSCGSLPEVVGDTGYFAEHDSAPSAAAAISGALSRPQGRAARDRITREFTRARRRGTLRQMIADALRTRVPAR